MTDEGSSSHGWSMWMPAHSLHGSQTALVVKRPLIAAGSTCSGFSLPVSTSSLQYAQTASMGTILAARCRASRAVDVAAE